MRIRTKPVVSGVFLHRTRFITLFSILILIHSGISRAQRADHGIIEGTVTNRTDGSPLLGVTILLRGTVLGGSTDAGGRYRIVNVPPGNKVVTISMIGYQKERREIVVGEGATVRLDVSLEETALQAEELVVTASKRPQSLEEVPVSLSVLDGREIRRRTITLLDQALRYIPGVNMTESQVNVRGSSGYSRALGTRILLLMDGIPLLTGDAGEIKFDAVPMYMVERVEVVKGAGSALYGSSALGGVINVITKTPREDFTQARIYSGLYDNPAFSEWKWWTNGYRVFNGIDLQRGGTVGALSYLVTAGARNNRGYRLLDDEFRWNANGKIWFDLSPLRNLTLGINYASHDHGNWIYWRDLKNALVPPPSTDLTERLLSTKFQVTSQYRETIDDNFAYIVRGNYYRTFFDTRSDTSDYSMRPLTRTQSTAQVFGLEWQGNYTGIQDHFLTFGIDGNYSHVDAMTYNRRDGGAVALYAQDDMKILEGLNVSFGFRGDLSIIDTNLVEGAGTYKIDGRLNPRLGVTWAPVEGTALRASFGTGFRAPSIAERFAVASGGGITTKPNPVLKSERSLSYEFGIKQEFNTFLKVDAAFFSNDYFELIEPVVDTDGRIVFRNVSRARIHGGEFGIQGSFFDRLLTLNAGYTYIYPRDLTLEKILKYRPRHILYANGTLTWAGMQLDADFRYLSRIEEIDEAVGILVRDYDKRVEVFVTDLRAGYTLPIAPVRVMFAVNNLFNYNYVEIIGNLAPIRNYTLTIEAGF